MFGIVSVRALASGVSGKSVAAHFLTDDLAVHNVENQET
jgi:hypothetical protein